MCYTDWVDHYTFDQMLPNNNHLVFKSVAGRKLLWSKTVLVFVFVTNPTPLLFFTKCEYPKAITPPRSCLSELIWSPEQARSGKPPRPLHHHHHQVLLHHHHAVHVRHLDQASPPQSLWSRQASRWLRSSSQYSSRSRVCQGRCHILDYMMTFHRNPLLCGLCTEIVYVIIGVIFPSPSSPFESYDRLSDAGSWSDCVCLLLHALEALWWWRRF